MNLALYAVTNWFSSLLERYHAAFFAEGRYKAYWNGLLVTLEISFFAILLGVLIGVLIAIIRVTAQKAEKKVFYLVVIDKLAGIYVNVIRGTPLMVQLMIIYNLIFTSRNTNEIVVGAVCFGINSGAYVAEIFRAGILSIDKGQTEAGRSLGFTGGQTMRYIILPQAVKNILPALGNEFIVLIKESSVASIIAVTELTKAAQYIGSRTWDVLPPLIIVAVFYLIIVLGLTKVLSIFERRLAQGDNR